MGLRGHHLDPVGPEPLHPGLRRRQAASAGRRGRSSVAGCRGEDRNRPAPETNSAGLALFRYRTRCGTVLGHTGNTFGFTQFATATPDGTRSTTVSISLQRTQKSPGWSLAVFQALRAAEERAVCAARAKGQ